MRHLVYLAAALLAAAPAMAQTPGPHPTKDPAMAPAGTYTLDKRHVGVVVRVAHGGGFSFSVFRMGDVQGSLAWDPAKIDNSKVTATIAANSLTSNVPGFADQLTGPMWLDAAQYPTITFTSTSIKRTGATTGTITGDLTMHGVTKPVTLEATLVGAGQGMRVPVVGFTAVAHVSRAAFGVGMPSPVVGDDLDIGIDLEFDKTAS